MGSIYALVLAAGRGTRFGGTLPKQYLKLGGTSVLRHAVHAFRAHKRIDGVLVAIRPEDRAEYDAALAGLDLLPPAPAAPSARIPCGSALRRWRPIARSAC